MANSKIIFNCKFYLLLVFLSQVSFNSYSQPKTLGCWLNYNNQVRLSDKIGFIFDYQYRTYTFIHDYEQRIIRGSMYYRLEKYNLQFSAGAAHANTSKYNARNDAKLNTDENRLFQQILVGNHFGSLFINHRYRLEQRFFKAQDILRFRYSLNIQCPINKKEIVPGAVYLSLTNELFINNKNPNFDRFRTIGEIGYFISPSFRLESGLLWQILEKSDRIQVRFSLLQTIDFSKK
jgi:hypothetical protein